MNVQFEPTITLGAVIQIVTFTAAGVFAYTRFVARMTRMESKINIMWSVFVKRWNSTRDPEDHEDFFGKGPSS